MSIISFQEWVLIKEGKKARKNQAELEKNKFVNSKDSSVTLKPSYTGYARGHQPHMSGTGVHQSNSGNTRRQKDKLRKDISDMM